MKLVLIGEIGAEAKEVKDGVKEVKVTAKEILGNEPRGRAHRSMLEGGFRYLGGSEGSVTAATCGSTLGR